MTKMQYRPRYWHATIILHVWWIKMKSLLRCHINELIWKYLCPKWAWRCWPIWPIYNTLGENAMLKIPVSLVNQNEIRVDLSYEWSHLIKSLMSMKTLTNMTWGFWSIWLICNTIKDNAMLQLSCKFGESKWNPYCFIMLTSSLGPNYVPNEQEDVDQYDPYAIPCKIMPCQSYPVSYVNQNVILVDLSC